MSTSDRGGEGVVNELDDDLADLNDLDVTWGFDLDAFVQEIAQQPPAAGEAGDETPEAMGSSQEGAVDASSVPAGRAESDSNVASASFTGQGNGEDPPAVLSGRPAHELSSWGRLPPTARGRTRDQSHRLEGEPAVHQERMNDGATDALLAVG